jgi:predicted PilT family ATPase
VVADELELDEDLDDETELLTDEEEITTIIEEEDKELDRLELDDTLNIDEDKLEEDELSDELAEELLEEETDVVIATLELDILADDWFCSSLPPPPQALKLNKLITNKK